MRRPAFTWFFGLAALCSGAVSCKYDPQPADGTLRCSTAGECPDGYSCRANTCWSSTARPRDAGLGGDAIAPAVLNRYVGRWLLDPTAKVVTSCGGNTPDTTLLSPPGAPSVMTIVAGSPGRSDLDAAWLCPALSLRLDAGGAHLFSGGPSCATDSSGDPANTWTATAFEVSTANGATGNHTAGYNRVDRYANGSVVNCVQMVTATLIKQ
jgi:hypothetical protein